MRIKLRPPPAHQFLPNGVLPCRIVLIFLLDEIRSCSYERSNRHNAPSLVWGLLEVYQKRAGSFSCNSIRKHGLIGIVPVNRVEDEQKKNQTLQPVENRDRS